MILILASPEQQRKWEADKKRFDKALREADLAYKHGRLTEAEYNAATKKAWEIYHAE